MGVVTVGGVGLEAMLGENMAATGTGELGRSRVDVQFSMLLVRGLLIARLVFRPLTSRTLIFRS
jgi:hypothetical protein